MSVALDSTITTRAPANTLEARRVRSHLRPIAADALWSETTEYAMCCNPFRFRCSSRGTIM